MGAVRNILKVKGSNTFSIAPDTIVFRALEIMVEKNVSALLVTDNEKLIGIFSERDYARKIALKGKDSKKTPIGDIMTGNVVTVNPESTIDDCMQLMTDKFIRHLPVIEDNKIVGVVSIGDVVKYIIEEQKFIIENMEHYISGS